MAEISSTFARKKGRLHRKILENTKKLFPLSKKQLIWSE